MPLYLHLPITIRMELYRKIQCNHSIEIKMANGSQRLFLILHQVKRDFNGLMEPRYARDARRTQLDFEIYLISSVVYGQGASYFS